MRTFWQRRVNEWSQAGSIQQQHFVATQHTNLQNKKNICSICPSPSLPTPLFFTFVASFSYSNLSSLLQTVAYICSFFVPVSNQHTCIFLSSIFLSIFLCTLRYLFVSYCKNMTIPMVYSKGGRGKQLREFFW